MFCPKFLLAERKKETYPTITAKIVYSATREKKIYFASVKFDVRAKRGQHSHKCSIICL